MKAFAISQSVPFKLPIVMVFVLVLALAGLSLSGRLERIGSLWPRVPREIDAGRPVPPATASVPFVFRFRGYGVLTEKNTSAKSGNPYWWLDSGAKLVFSGNQGSTVIGDLARFDRWRLEYAQTNAADTDNGYHPQNIFRLVSRYRWLDYRQTLYFQIKNDNLSASPNRNESNGVLLFNRYQDGDNLYYAGIRVDGTAVIKKKYLGNYYTLAQTDILNNGRPYDRSNNPNVLPKGEWLGIQSVVHGLPGGKVSIDLYFDRTGTGLWEKVLTAVDDGQAYGSIIDRAGFGGIRSDFMDVLFWQYRVTAV